MALSVAGNFEVLLGDTVQPDSIGTPPRPEKDFQQEIHALKQQFLKL
ncbi:MAG: hypothetical protein U9R28_03885 [Pseudomonadota bacterium]|nr:hypothetical protein [Pseudomonadota bacterium]